MTEELARALAWVAVAVLGATVGSFLNVVIARVPEGESIAWPGSRCPACRTPIRWYDNVPIASWIVLRARCRACRAPIPARYPVVEAVGLAAALVVFARHGFTWAAAAELVFVDAIVALAFIDLATWLLPNVLTWSVIAFGILMGPLGITPAVTMRYALYGAGIGFGAFAALSWIGAKVFKKEALGFGDVWLLAGLGAWMGPKGLLPITLLASIQGAVVGIALVLAGKGEPGPQAESEAVRPSTPPLRGYAQDERTTATHSARPERSAAGAESKDEPTSTLTEDDWVPPKNAVPFGPFLVAAALEWLWLSGPLARAVPVLELFR